MSCTTWRATATAVANCAAANTYAVIVTATWHTDDHGTGDDEGVGVQVVVVVAVIMAIRAVAQIGGGGGCNDDDSSTDGSGWQS